MGITTDDLVVVGVLFVVLLAVLGVEVWWRRGR